MIEAEGITFTYKKTNEVQAVRGVSLRIESGSFVSVVGRSGSGKSTLLHCLSGLLTPDSGSVRYDGTDIYAMKDRELSAFRNANIGFVFQNFYLEPNFNLLENVMLPLLVRRMSVRQAKARAMETLKKFGIDDRAYHFPAEMSGGECQRAAIARAIVGDPTYIFADEPTGNLDRQNGRLIVETLHELKDSYGKTVIMVTHNEADTEGSDAVYVTEDGKISVR
ncbi:MAG TPA: ABC transporter ATP-binding protein [Firmicutes bacterium]|nr:ABC transporter ATP-binding protein [Bacillota bacterium]